MMGKIIGPIYRMLQSMWRDMKLMQQFEQALPANKINKNIENKWRRRRITLYLFVVASVVIATTKWFVGLFY